MRTPDPLRHLLDAAVEGDDVATAELVRRTQVDLWRLCTVLGSRGEEEDLVQETYLRALGSLGSYRGDAPVRSWFMSIGRNVCADHVRRRERHRRLFDRIRPLAADLVEQPPAGVDGLLDHLDADRREAFVLTQMLGMSYVEAAATMDCPVGTIRSRVARARADLLEGVRHSQAC